MGSTSDGSGGSGTLEAGACVDDVSVWGFLMSEVAHYRARVAGVAKNRPGDAAALAAARLE